MSGFADAFVLAAALIISGEPELARIVQLSLSVSLGATIIATLIGAPLGVLLAIRAFPGRQAVLVVVNGLLGLPPVVVGLVVYLAVSRAGPLGSLGLLFTPTAMVMAQTALTLPIVIALTHRHIDGLWHDYGDAFRMDGARGLVLVATLLAMGRAGVMTGFLTAFGRAIAEVGAIMMVGGNIRGHTRTMTTAIALETSRGELALALALGFILITLTLAIAAATFALNRAIAR